ncbi:MAG: hypothetical protein AAF297_00170 [Planctomycetota bacterium]
MNTRLSLTTALGLSALVTLPALGLQQAGTAERQPIVREGVPIPPGSAPGDEIRVYDMSMLRGGGSSLPIAMRVGNLQNVVDFRHSMVTDETFAIRATPENHERLEVLLDQVFDIVGGGYDERDDPEDRFEVEEEEAETAYVVRMMLADAPADVTLGVGDRLDVRTDPRIQPLFMPQASMSGGERATVTMTEMQRYIAGYMPVVSGSAVGYQADVQSVESGFRIAIHVEPGPEGMGMLAVEGLFATAEVMKETLQLGPATLPIGLPLTRERSIESEALVPLESGLIIVASVQGIDGGSSRLLFAVEVIEHEIDHNDD